MTTLAEQWLARMPLEDRVGQMTQLDISLVLAEGCPVRLNASRLQHTLQTQRLGSLLNTPFSGGARCGASGWTASQWRVVVDQIQTEAAAQGLPPLVYGIDSVHGANYVRDATLLPHQLGLAASFDERVAASAGWLTAKDSRAANLPWLFAPILGHFIGYSAPRNGHDREGSWLPHRVLRETFAPPFQAAVDAGAQTAMESYQEVNGEPTAASRALLQGLLREEMGFEGVLVTDWREVRNLHSFHRVAASEEDAVLLALSSSSSLDVSMVPTDDTFYETTLRLAQEGKLPASRLKVSAERVLRLKEWLGLLGPYPSPAPAAPPPPPSAATQALLDSGTLIDDELAQVGAVTPPPTIVQAMHALAPAMDVTHLQGCELPPGSAREQQALGCALTSSTEELRAAAANADAVVLCLGEDPYTEKPGDLSELELDEGQRALAAALAAARTPMALVLVSGRPRLLKGVEQLSAVQAVLQSFLPGPHGGTALAETLLGLHDPSGRLPLSWPVHSSSLLYPHWHPVTQQCDGEPHCGVAWPFGHGLSYALLTYSPLALSAATLPREGAVTASVTVTNHADHALNHSVLLFAAADYRRIVPAAQELKDFVRLELPPRGSAEARFTLRAEIFAYVGLAGKRLVESGDYSLWLDPMLRPEGAGAGAGAVLRQRRQLEAQASEGAGQRERGGIARLRVEGDCEGVGCASGPPAPSGGGVPVGMATGTFVVGWLMGLASAGGVWVGTHRRMFRAAMAKAARVLVRRRRAGGSRTHVGEHDKRGDDCSPEVNMLGMGCRRSDSASSSLADGPSLTPAGSANSLSSIAEEMHQLGREPAGPLERTVAGADGSLPMPPELRI